MGRQRSTKFEISRYSFSDFVLYGSFLISYFFISNIFLDVTFLNLTPNRLEALDFPFYVDSSSVTLVADIFSAIISILLVIGFYMLQKGNLSPYRTDISIQVLAIIAFLPLVSYFFFHIMWLRQTDASWEFDFSIMDEIAGWQISNEWPFETTFQDTRWKFYQIGVINSVRVVLFSIFFSTILGVIVGVLRLSKNKLLSNLAKIYVDLFRNVPLVAQLFFVSVWFLTTLEPFREVQNNNFLGWFYWSNRGFVFPHLEFSNSSLFFLAILLILGSRIYFRFTERISTPKETTSAFSLKRPLIGLGPKKEPIIVDSLYSFALISIIYSVFNVVSWEYKFTLSGLVSWSDHYSIFVFGSLLMVLSMRYNRKLDEDGLNKFTESQLLNSQVNPLHVRLVIFLLSIILIYLSLSIEKPNLITEKNGEELSWGLWKFEEGTFESVSSVFLVLMMGLTLYTSAQISEVVRGSIQALPVGQVEASVSLGLSSYQRLSLIILPQALRSMIPSLTNQYLNCWKNSSLAILVGFTDFYAILNTVVNNAGNAVAIFAIILLTYQAGSLVISAVMNDINQNVTKVKI